MERHELWIDDPPEASAEVWSAVWSRVTGLMTPDEDDASEEDQLLDFVLGEALRRCAFEAEERESGILGDQVQTDIESTRAWIERSST
ncbi:MAG: hypothetical protein ACFB50_11115 [Rubrobacteraceae bacterium]